MTNVYLRRGDDEKQRNAFNDLDRQLIGELSDTYVELPSHGIPRPSWFKPGGVTLDDLGQMPRRRRRT